MIRQHAMKLMPVWYPHMRMVWRVGLLLLVIGGGIYLASVILTPFVTARQETISQGMDEQSVKEKQEENTRLQGQVAWLKSPLGAAEESRRRGLIKDGEQAVILNLPAQLSQGTSPDAEPTSAFVVRQWWPVLILLVLSFLVGSGWLVRRRRLAQLRRPAGTLTPRSELQRRRPPTRQ